MKAITVMAGTHPLPILISDQGTEILLERIPLTGASGTSAYNEDWLQDLLYKHPQSLPIAEINPLFAGLVPICRELLTPAGPLDVLYATREGRLVVLEAKLWRNPEARRKVIGQILDYAKELSHWSYETLDAAIRAAGRRDQGTARSLFEVVREQHGGLDEAQFIDAVSRNLRRGELLLLIAGDGIRENVGAITQFIEDHGTLHFTFGLIEMAIYQMPNGMQLVQPRVLAHSEIIRRIVVEVRGGELAEPDADSPEVDREAMPRPDLEQQRLKFSDFWTEWLEKYPLDDQSQPVKPPSKGTNQFFDLPKESKGRLSAVAAEQSGKAGVYISFRREPVSDRIYAALMADQTAINAAIGQPVQWASSDKWHSVQIWRDFGDQMLTQRRAEVQAWLGDLVNRFVNTFRPRIEALLRDQ
ncbi:MAG: DUF4268 domain-containing protein [Prosthecobacter sp.]|uniref:DUF4268 domain-containing protein n=1 Tax=Prosthecobacter sp. TaxID=1965333 RepID=UPI00261B8E2E|nr:DUF4268 domain-containing protein [Prosthecobacter sp.]MCF7789933.1 DUF4268 domain-containing protein [Prosthecobacter sp.]